MLGAQSTVRGYIRADVSLTKVHLRMVCTSSSYALCLILFVVVSKERSHYIALLVQKIFLKVVVRQRKVRLQCRRKMQNKSSRSVGLEPLYSLAGRMSETSSGSVTLLGIDNDMDSNTPIYVIVILLSM